jgi:predicted metal-dependent phosphoesterase TrpH
MLTFSRNKIVSIHRKDERTLHARGILEDDIYGMEVDVDITLPHLEIVWIDGKWTRMENRECPRAIPFLQEALGFRLTEEGFTQKLQKTVGRKSCRHFANILLECCEAVTEAVALPDFATEKAEETKPLQKESPAKEIAGKPARETHKEARKAPPHNGGETTAEPLSKKSLEGMIIDLHVHSAEGSPCSSAPLDDLIAEAKQIGLNGMCLTDHNHVWPRETVNELQEKHGFLILRGNEITTDQGDMLVFGFEEDIKGIIPLDELRKMVLQVNGFIIAAHPFRGFLTFGIGQLGLTTEKAMARPLFQHVDAIEVLNSKVSEKENLFSSQVAEGLTLPGTGGSDAHEVVEVGIYATRFFDAITCEEDFLKALHQRNYQPLAFRKALKQ